VLHVPVNIGDCQTDFIKEISHRSPSSTPVTRIVPEFADNELFTRKNRAFPAYAESGGVDTTGTAYTTTALHVPVEAEFSALQKTFIVEAEEDRRHHFFRPAHTYL